MASKKTKSVLVPLESCTCDVCKDMCQRPCWPTPSEAKKIIDAGFGHRLMEDYWIDGQVGHVNILCPALSGYENKTAPFWPSGKCTFQDKNGLCELHDLGLKPIEGRVADCRKMNKKHNLHEMMMIAWNNREAENLVSDWKKCSTGEMGRSKNAAYNRVRYTMRFM